MTLAQRRKLDRLILDYACAMYGEGLQEGDESQAAGARKTAAAHRRLGKYLDTLTATEPRGK
jgi:hypothetical protein